MKDYHGTEVSVDVVYKSAGVFVYLEVGQYFARLTPEQAAGLAALLVDAANEAE